MKPFENMRIAIPKLGDPEVMSAFRTIFRTLESDLEEIGFEPSTQIELMDADLAEVLNAIDEKQEELDESAADAVQEAIAEAEEEE